MPEKRFVITCQECKFFHLGKDGVYGVCARMRTCGIARKITDFCNYAELPFPEHDDHDVSGLTDD